MESNDIEAFNSLITDTDLKSVSAAVKEISKETLQHLVHNILLKLQQGVEKSPVLWLSLILKFRWIDTLKFLSK